MPKADPYSSRTHRRIDVVLFIVTILLTVFLFRIAAYQHKTSGLPTSVQIDHK